MRPSIEEIRDILESFCCENWGTKFGMKLSAQICQISDDDYEGFFRLYKEVVCLM